MNGAALVGSRWVSSQNKITVTALRWAANELVGVGLRDGMEAEFPLNMLELWFLETEETATLPLAGKTDPSDLTGIPESILGELECIVSRLSPENLRCDGEASRAQVKAKSIALNQQWRRIEQRIGRAVSKGAVEERSLRRF